MVIKVYNLIKDINPKAEKILKSNDKYIEISATVTNVL